MKPTAEELRSLNADPEFQKLFREDPELNALECDRGDEAAELLLLSEVLGFGVRVGKLPTHPLTAARWSLLWTLDNAYTRVRPVTVLDVEVFLYVLTRDVRRIDCSLHEIPVAASGYLAASGLNALDAHDAITRIIDAAFLPLRMVPDEQSSEERRYDALWLARIAGVAARESGMTLDYCKFEMSLGEVTCLFIAMLQRETPEEYARRIRRRPDLETEAKILKRTLELQNEYLAKKKHQNPGEESCRKS